ncbi:MAG: hypothetical protein ACOX9R_10390 [Armatimonadota bacterium]|jgi:hypothetical protein
MDILGAIFQKLTQLGGGSEFLPLLLFCIVLVLLGLGLGIAVMRLIRRGSTDPEAEQSG